MNPDLGLGWYAAGGFGVLCLVLAVVGTIARRKKDHGTRGSGGDVSHKWCGACQDNFPEDHYDGQDAHKIGHEWGPTGATRAELRDLRQQLAEGGKTDNPPRTSPTSPGSIDQYP